MSRFIIDRVPQEILQSLLYPIQTQADTAAAAYEQAAQLTDSVYSAQLVAMTQLGNVASDQAEIGQVMEANTADLAEIRRRVEAHVARWNEITREAEKLKLIDDRIDRLRMEIYALYTAKRTEKDLTFIELLRCIMRIAKVCLTWAKQGSMSACHIVTRRLTLLKTSSPTCSASQTAKG